MAAARASADATEKCPECGKALEDDNAVERTYGEPDKKGERQVVSHRCPNCGATWRPKEA